MGAFALPVVVLGFAVRQQFDPLIEVDQTAIRDATSFSVRHGLVSALEAVQVISQPVCVYVVAVGVVSWVWRAKKLKGRALWALVTMMAGWAIGAGAKLVVQRERPIVDDPVPHAAGYSFPSGHVLNLTLAAGVMVFLLWPLLSVAARRIGIAVATVAVVAVGLDRIFIGAHFPSDVVAGSILGIGIVFSSWIGFIGRTAATSSPGPSHPA
ncbi:phosphatase PAP2 family protein [Streptomyces sp. SID13031]|uniref:phosphatase PAP2 family protein n=1 Tax=Streptomyces sp. SID13031 TaxID=2706046 RepID=UPI0013CB61D1|nr:phosphatase PAP2 family protein [Streptomyces sp. SID13031]NEA35436.1 phosphatase PAP2 family protein [Streptomyces sp. SID13031]